MSYFTFRGDEVNELKQAYERLGLPEMAPREEVEKRYTTLMRKARSRAKQQENGRPADGSEDDFALVTEAYRLILAYEDRKTTDAFNEQEYGKYKGMAGRAQKLDHFWRYYKFHTFGAIALVALIIYGIVSYIDHREHQRYLASLPPVDLEISFMGNYFLKDDAEKEEPLEKALLAAFPDWNRFKTTLTPVPADEMNQYAYMQKALVTLATEHPDVYIMDRNMFAWAGMQGVFEQLDGEVEGELGPLPKEGLAFKLQTEEDTAEHVYGIDLSGSALATDLPLYQQEMIIGIRVDAKNSDKAIAFIKKYLETIPK